MNILVVCHYGLYQDLSWSFVHQQAKAYVALGHCVRVVIPIPIGKRRCGHRMEAPLVHDTADGVELYYLRFLSLSNWGERIGFNRHSGLAALRMYCCKMLVDFRLDIIHAHTLGFDSELGGWLKEQLGCPLVVTTHGSDVSIPAEQGRMLWLKARCAQADTVVAVSSVLGDKLRSCGTDTPICSILNGFNFNILLANAKKTPLSLIQVGGLNQQKRVSVTLRAFAMLHTRYPTATLVLVGQGEERYALERLCCDLQIINSVHFLGQISNAQVLSEMAKAQFFVMPSVREGFGIVYLEAMACGCVTIGTEGEGIGDLIVSKKNGFLVPPDDALAIVTAIEQCYENPQQAASIAKRGREAAQGLTWQQNATQYLALFQSLLRYYR